MAWNVYGGMGRTQQNPINPALAPVEDTAALDRITLKMQAGDAVSQREYWLRVMDRPTWCFLCDPKIAQEMIEAGQPETSQPGTSQAGTSQAGEAVAGPADAAGGPEGESVAKPAARHQSHPSPLSWTIEGRTMIGVFTSEAAALETHRQLHGVATGAVDSQVPQAAVMAIPVADAIAWLARMPVDKVKEVVFNRRNTVASPTAVITNLPGLYEWALDRLPDSLWDPYVRSVQAANQPQAWSRLRRRLALLDRWFLPLDPQGANVPLVVADGTRHFLALAVSAPLAQRAFTSIAGKDVEPRIGQSPRADVVKMLETISADPKGPKEVAINVGGAPVVIELTAFITVLKNAAA
ncbi:MAG: hypothetical protein SGJ11_12685 [Phycisphaerae bacterium]|nr:hypothetical protein [Phycisphaerae bacterium]